MNRLLSAMKHFAELYLIIVGGGYTLVSVVALVLNMHTIYTSAYPVEARDLRGLNENLFLFLGAAPTLIAGIGIHRCRWWGLLLAGAVGVVAITSALVTSQVDPWEYHNFTVALPMALILIWAILPPTWVEFKRHCLKAS